MSYDYYLVFWGMSIFFDVHRDYSNSVSEVMTASAWVASGRPSFHPSPMYHTVRHHAALAGSMSLS